MPRTFPNNMYFDSTNPNSMQKPLLNILKAFANNNPTIGYCQVEKVSNNVMLRTSFYLSA